MQWFLIKSAPWTGMKIGMQAIHYNRPRRIVKMFPQYEQWDQNLLWALGGDARGPH